MYSTYRQILVPLAVAATVRLYELLNGHIDPSTTGMIEYTQGLSVCGLVVNSSLHSNN